MANAKVTKPAKIPLPEEISLTLNKTEASALAAILAHVGFTGENGVSDITKALKSVGFDWNNSTRYVTLVNGVIHELGVSIIPATHRDEFKRAGG